jgi:hypothetical protein
MGSLTTPHAPPFGGGIAPLLTRGALVAMDDDFPGLLPGPTFYEQRLL